MNTKVNVTRGYVSTSGWRGYQQPIFAVAGANDTGNYEDSPCPSSLRKQEISGFTHELRKAGIKYATVWCQTSNVFCLHQYVVVSEADHARAYEMAKEYEQGKHLFYKCEILTDQLNKIKP